MHNIERLALASNNPHKLIEMSRLLPKLQIAAPVDLGLKFYYEEIGSTFFENAFGKAEHLYKLAGVPVLSDDSGLSVNALGNDPGVRSARYGAEEGGKLLTDGERNRYLLSKLEGIDDRRASFVCCMVLVLSDQRFYAIQETLSGEIAQKPAGSSGFGYDPIFYIEREGRTVAEMTDSEKDSISHRGRAARRMRVLLESL